jgi:EamA domain-containing membrane protein RarD
MSAMKERRLNLSDILLIGATRGMLGAGVALLAARKLSEEQRRAIGRTLVLVGIATTVPLAMRVFAAQSQPAELSA